MDDQQEKVVLEKVLNLPCSGCGGKLAYSAKEKKIICEHCGQTEAIDAATDRVIEQDLDNALSGLTYHTPECEDQKVFDCQSCGSKFMVNNSQVKVECGFCGSNNVNLEAFEHSYIEPMGIIPFQVPKEKSNELFSAWIKKGWFRPNKLKRLAEMDALHGIYIPFWTYDAQTESTYSGEAGYREQIRKQVLVNGQYQTKTVSETRWVHRSGHFSHFFDDVLVVASTGVKQKLMESIEPFNLKEVINYDARLMLGWEAEVYSLELDEGYKTADKIMDKRLREFCKAEIGGDTQRRVTVHSQKYYQTFKMIMLPIWISSYKYQDKIYQFAINGQTGKVNGKKPTSWVKIVSLILFFVLIIVAIVLFKKYKS